MSLSGSWSANLSVVFLDVVYFRGISALVKQHIKRLKFSFSEIGVTTFLLTYQKVSLQFMLTEIIKRAFGFRAAPRIYILVSLEELCSQEKR